MGSRRVRSCLRVRRFAEVAMGGLWLAAASMAAADSPLKVIEPRLQDSEFSPPLKEVVLQPGEGFVAIFGVEGFRMTSDNFAWLDVGLDLRNGKGESIWSCESLELSKNYNPFRSPRIPMTVWFTSPTEALPGPYSLKISPIDKIAEMTTSFEVPLKIVPPRLAVINPYLAADREGETEVPARFVLRQTALLFVTVTGFSRPPLQPPAPTPPAPSEGGDKKPEPPPDEVPVESEAAMDVTLEYALLDADGKVIYAFPDPVVMKEPIPVDVRSVSSHCFVSCTSPGRFAIRVTLRDGLAQTTAQRVVPFEVVGD